MLFRIITLNRGDDLTMCTTVSNVYAWLCESRWIYGSRLRVLSVTQVTR